MTHDGYFDLSLSGNNDLIFFVCQTILYLNLSFVNIESLSVNFRTSFSFSSQYGTRITIVRLSSKSHSGISGSSLTCLKSLITEAINLVGKPASENFFVIRITSASKLSAIFEFYEVLYGSHYVCTFLGP